MKRREIAERLAALSAGNIPQAWQTDGRVQCVGADHMPCDCTEDVREQGAQAMKGWGITDGGDPVCGECRQAIWEALDLWDILEQPLPDTIIDARRHGLLPPII